MPPTRHFRFLVAAIIAVAGHARGEESNTPSLGEQPIGSVLDIRPDAYGLLTVKSALPDTALAFPGLGVSEVRVSVPTMPGFCLIDVSYPKVENDPGNQKAPPADPSEPRQPARLRLSHHSYNTPGHIHVLTQVLFIPTHLQISRDFENLTGSLSVSFIQNTSPYDNPEAALESVRLSVRSSYTYELPTNPPEVRIDLAEPTLARLRQRHPAEVAKYLRPLLTDLGQAHLLLIDPATAWQVLGDQYTPPNELNTQLDVLLAELDDVDFSVRSKAAQKLSVLGPQAAAALKLRQPAANWSPEQRTAVDAFLASLSPLSEQEAKTLQTSADFLLDVLQLPEPDLRTLAEAQFKKSFPLAASKLSDLIRTSSQATLTPQQADTLRQFIAQPHAANQTPVAPHQTPPPSTSSPIQAP